MIGQEFIRKAALESNNTVVNTAMTRAIGKSFLAGKKPLLRWKGVARGIKVAVHIVLPRILGLRAA